MREATLLDLLNDFQISVTTIKNAYSNKLYRHIGELINIMDCFLHGATGEFERLIIESRCNVGFPNTLALYIKGDLRKAITEANILRTKLEVTCTLSESEQDRILELADRIENLSLLRREKKALLHPWLNRGLADCSENFLKSITKIQKSITQKISEPQLDKIFHALINECDEYTQILSLLPKYQTWMNIIDQYKLEISILLNLYRWNLQLLEDIYILNRDIAKGILPSGVIAQPIEDVFTTETLITPLSKTTHNELESFQSVVTTIFDKSSEFITFVRSYQATLQSVDMSGITCTTMTFSTDQLSIRSFTKN